MLLLGEVTRKISERTIDMTTNVKQISDTMIQVTTSSERNKTDINEF
jgi:hypothetical protein